MLRAHTGVGFKTWLKKKYTHSQNFSVLLLFISPNGPGSVLVGPSGLTAAAAVPGSDAGPLMLSKSKFCASFPAEVNEAPSTG